MPKTELKEKTVPASPEELRSAIQEIFWRDELSDPDCGSVRNYNKGHKDAICKEIFDNEDFFRRAFGELQEGQHHDLAHLQIIKDGISINVCLYQHSDGDFRLIIDSWTKKWADERETFGKSLFVTDGLTQAQKEHFAFPSEILYKRLQDIGHPLLPLPYKRVQNFDPSRVTDRLGKGIDENILELMRYLNEMGLETSGSCGGHEGEEHGGYIDFLGKDLERIVVLAEEWRKQGGKFILISPGGRHLSGVRLEVEPGTSLREIQEDLDRFTDFLARKIEPKSVFKLSLREVQYRLKRKLRKWQQEKGRGQTLD